MRRIKRTIGMILAAAMMLSMCGCGSVSKNKTTDSSNISDNETTITEEIATTEQTTTTEETATTEDKGMTNVEKKKYLATNLLDTVEAGQLKQRELDDKFVTSATEFAINILKKDAKERLANGENVMVSPDSIMTCLAMTANGAKGDTLSGMESTICPGLDIADFNEYLYSYNNGREDNEFVKFNVANSIWIRNDEDRIKINDGYLGKVKTYYDAEFFSEAFSEQTAKDINAWISDETNGMINKAIDDKIDEDTVMFLINAIAFEGEWAEKYEEYQIDENGSFTDFSGTKQKVSMLNSTEGYYMKDENSQAFLKYYKGYDYAFMGILPDEGVSVPDYIEGLTGEKFADLYKDRNNHNNTDVIARIPEFKYDYETTLDASLMELGMQKAFQTDADFSDMAYTKTGYLYISTVIHKTHIELDRNGTKAAAVTVVEMTDCAAEPVEREVVEINLDRPFVYAIVDVNTGIPVFIGAVNSIE